MKPMLTLLGVVSISVTVAISSAQNDSRAVVTIDKLPFVCNKPDTTYRMTRDLSCPDSGILILASGVTIDLDGHTLTYGTGKKLNEKVITYNSLQSGNVGHHAIYVTTDPRRSKDAPVKVGWNYRFTGVVITNGRIKSGAGGISYSDAIDVSGTVNCEIKDLTIEVDAPDSSAIIGGRKSKIHDCKLIHTGTHVSNRHAQLAVIVSGADAEVYNCTLLGGPQVGIKATSGSEIHHNEIRINVVVTNGYGIQGYGQKNIHAHHNRIIAKNGRGLHVSEKSVGWRVHHNYIEARERANKEYPKGLDTHGIKLEGCREAKVYRNVVVCESTERGNPTPLNFSIRANSNNEVYDNVFVAKKVTPKERATAIYLVGGDGTGTTVRDNVFFSNDRMFEVYWGPGNNFTFRNCRFYRLTATDKITTFYFWNSKPARNINFVDCTFGPGVSPNAYHFPKTPENWPADAEFAVSSTVTLIVASNGVPVPGAKVRTVKSAGGLVGDAKIFTTDREGKTRHELRQFSVHFHAKDRHQVGVVKYSPYVLRIDAGEAGTHDVEAWPEKMARIEIDLKTGKRIVTPPTPESAPDLAKIIAEAKAAAGPKP